MESAHALSYLGDSRLAEPETMQGTLDDGDGVAVVSHGFPFLGGVVNVSAACLPANKQFLRPRDALLRAWRVED